MSKILPPRRLTYALSPTRSAALVLMLGTALGTPPSAFAESALTLDVPAEVSEVAATTFDEDGEAVGQSHFAIGEESNGRLRMQVSMAIEGGGTNYSEAVLAPVTGALVGRSGSALSHRIIEERSQATSASGQKFPLLVVDHLRGRVSCYANGILDEHAGQDARQKLSESEVASGQHVEIDENDRVVNVPMQYLFLPLVRGEIDSLSFQIATCPGDEPVIHNMIAVRGRSFTKDGRKIIKVEYGPDFGKAVAWLASRVLPSFSFWFEAESGEYLGHRMPLHRKGPEITLVRTGLTPPQIGVD